MAARMYPVEGPRDLDEASFEDDIYESLKLLPDDYVVIHSFKYRKKHNGGMMERESDFVIYNRELGILCIEAKAGYAAEKICYRDSSWYYGSGRPFAHDPYDQAAGAMYHLRDKIEGDICDGGLGLKGKCTILSAVWFPHTKRKQLKDCQLPAHALFDFTLTYEDLGNPQAKIEEIFGARKKGTWNARREYCPAEYTNLSEAEEERILQKVLLPRFDIVEMLSVRFERAEKKYVRLLESQKRILDFLVDQRSAVINGAAGTGKTLIAIERAVQLARAGERVLLLCFNSLLSDYIGKEIENKQVDHLVDVMTISKLCREKTGSFDDYEALGRWLGESAEDFEWDHVIVDEGQDFGLEAIADAGILDSLYLVTLEKENGTFYVFYDERQLIQGIALPDVIRDADCRMTLYVNCRNTRSIADCSINSLSKDSESKVASRRRQMLSGKTLSVLSGEPPKFWFNDNRREIERLIDEQISKLKQEDVLASNMVVLTCSTLKRTRHGAKLCESRKVPGQMEWGTTKVPVYSCREFKGLEADVVFLVDVDRQVWEQDYKYQAPPGLLFYTGASRAKFQLYVAGEMSEDEAADVVDILLGVDNRHRRRAFIQLENVLRKSLS